MTFADYCLFAIATPALQGPSVAPWRRSWALPAREGPVSTDPDGSEWPLRTR